MSCIYAYISPGKIEKMCFYWCDIFIENVLQEQTFCYFIKQAKSKYFVVKNIMR